MYICLSFFCLNNKCASYLFLSSLFAWPHSTNIWCSTECLSFWKIPCVWPSTYILPLGIEGVNSCVSLFTLLVLTMSTFSLSFVFLWPHLPVLSGPTHSVRWNEQLCKHIHFSQQGLSPPSVCVARA